MGQTRKTARVAPRASLAQATSAKARVTDSVTVTVSSTSLTSYKELAEVTACYQMKMTLMTMLAMTRTLAERRTRTRVLTGTNWKTRPSEVSSVRSLETSIQKS